MDSKAIQAKLNELEKREVELQLQLDQTICEFIDQLPLLTETWIKKETRRKIESNAKRTLELGAEGMAELKKKMNALIEQLPSICDNTVNSKKEEWPHHIKKDNNSNSYVGGSSQESFFPSCFRDVISNLGAVLGEFGLTAEVSGHSSSWEKLRDGTYCYKINPGFDDRNVSSVEKYNEIMQEHHQLTISAFSTSSELEKAKAGELWDSV